MKKVFRRPLAVLMAMLMFIQLGGASFAVSDEVTVEVIIDCAVGSQKAQLITDMLIAEANGFISITPASSCNHTMAVTGAITIEHRVFPTTPRCRQTSYRVDYCTRSGCNHTIMTLIGQKAIFCCT
ncbi:MAG: hypothetical protein FWD48_04205 [Oscillospiraceae bacterium]|nr:hypothetical protein [Oscillospiraceae bacterium]